MQREDKEEQVWDREYKMSMFNKYYVIYITKPLYGNRIQH